MYRRVGFLPCRVSYVNFSYCQQTSHVCSSPPEILYDAPPHFNTLFMIVTIPSNATPFASSSKLCLLLGKLFCSDSLGAVALRLPSFSGYYCKRRCVLAYAVLRGPYKLYVGALSVIGSLSLNAVYRYVCIGTRSV